MTDFEEIMGNLAAIEADLQRIDAIIKTPGGLSQEETGQLKTGVKAIADLAAGIGK